MAERFSWGASAPDPRTFGSRFSERGVVGDEAFGRHVAAITQSQGEVGFDDDYYAPLWSEARSELLKRRRPRLFISHKQQDSGLATGLADIAEAERFDTWLDVLDPDLTGMPSGERNRVEAAVVAALIEVALLNCTHVLVVHTAATRHSRWVPYEYGRVKDSRVYSQQAAARLYDAALPPEYMHLGPRFRSDIDVSSWLAREHVKWSVARLSSGLPD